MALKNKCNLSIKYTLGRNISKENYKNILTTNQLSEIDDSIEKKIVIEDAYYKISQFNGTKNEIEATVCVYKDESKIDIICTKSYKFIPDVSEGSLNFIKQCYEYLKTLPEYVDAVDC